MADQSSAGDCFGSLLRNLVRSGDSSRFAAKRRLKPLLRTLLKFLPSTDGAMRHGRLAMTPGNNNSSCQEDDDRSEDKESGRQTDGDIEDGFFHPTTAGVDRALTPEDTTQGRSLDLQQNSRNQGHGDDDLDNVQVGEQLALPPFMNWAHYTTLSTDKQIHFFGVLWYNNNQRNKIIKECKHETHR
jgi:hypothetical protein